ncbi:hypothetical protein AGMMS4956_19960 [Bacteroidia bacterium]|nr:hypothetical protein AGMMS4956_19960 [Bacteroidia bacterium]
MKRKKSISIVLGAGFSVPMEYPIGNELSGKLLNCDRNNIAFTDSGELVKPVDDICHPAQTTNEATPTSIWDWCFKFCKDMMKYYKENIAEEFNYEEFYDYYKQKAENDTCLQELFRERNYEGGQADFTQYIGRMDIIYNQLIEHYLKDKNGENFYEDAAFARKPTFEGYTGFLKCIETLLSKGYEINVHTLNHDLFFERLNQTEWINDQICDGFDSCGSPYYGKIESGGGSEEMCKLEQYTGKYDKPIRLYKLHGSLNYYVYHTPVGRYDAYIKIKKGIAPKELYKNDVNDWTNFHPDFLTGKSKTYSGLYKKLLSHFRQNLSKAKMLIIIGYGCGDKQINQIIKQQLKYKRRTCIVIDPREDKVKKFVRAMCKKTKLVKKEIKSLTLTDLQICKRSRGRKYHRYFGIKLHSAGTGLQAINT